MIRSALLRMLEFIYEDLRVSVGDHVRSGKCVSASQREVSKHVCVTNALQVTIHTLDICKFPRMKQRSSQ